jgi:hypothetical protein
MDGKDITKAIILTLRGGRNKRNSGLKSEKAEETESSRILNSISGIRVWLLALRICLPFILETASPWVIMPLKTDAEMTRRVYSIPQTMTPTTYCARKCAS